MKTRIIIWGLVLIAALIFFIVYTSYNCKKYYYSAKNCEDKYICKNAKVIFKDDCNFKDCLSEPTPNDCVPKYYFWK